MEASTVYKNKYSSTSTTPKVERKFIEKKRRSLMKTLYFNLTSLLPPNHIKEGVSLPDKIDEAVRYINTLKLKLEKYEEKKNEKLLGTKRGLGINDNDHITKTASAFHFEIHELMSSTPNLDIVLVNGLHNFSTFNEVMRLLHQQPDVEVVQANFSESGNSTFHVLHQKYFGGELMLRYETTASIFRRLNDLIHGTSLINDIDITDFEILEF